jgi:YtkA-like
MNCLARPDQWWVGSSYARRSVLVLVVVAAVLGIGCQKPPNTSSGVIVEFQIEPKPVTVGLVVVSLTLTDTASHPVTGAQIAVEADMLHAGMSPVFAQSKEVGPGQYQSQLSLGMAGDWVILLHGSLPHGEKLERQFDVRDVRPN